MDPLVKKLEGAQKAPEDHKAKPEVKKAAPGVINRTGPKTYCECHNGENVVFKPEDLSMSDGYYIREAKNSTFDFQSKIRNIFVEKCSRVKIICKVSSRDLSYFIRP